ncbi:MAG: PKD domain-containing protein, partial [Nanoarchaeota archaeon]
AAASGTGSCIVNFTLEEERNFLVCAAGKQGKIPYYEGENGYWYNIKFDRATKKSFAYPIYAHYASFKTLNFKLPVGGADAVKIKTAIEIYTQRCEGNSCIVPFTFISQKGALVVSDLTLKQSCTPPLHSLENIRKKPALLNASNLQIRLEKFPSLRTPFPGGYPDDYDEDFTLEIKFLSPDGNVLDSADEDFTIEKVPIVSVRPLNAIVGSSVEFDASYSDSPQGNDLKKFVWDFGDGVKTESTTPKIIHTYTKPGIYTLTLSIEDDQRLVGAASFEIGVDSAYNLIKRTLDRKKDALADLSTVTSGLSSFELSLLAIDKSALDSYLSGIEQQFKQSNSSSSRESEFITIVNQLNSLQVPIEIVSTQTYAESQVPADLRNIDVNYVAALSGEDADKSLKDAVGAWQDLNVVIKISGNTRAIEYDDSSTEEKFTFVKVSTEPRESQVLEDVFFIFRAPDSAQFSKQLESVASGVKGIKYSSLAGHEEVEFAVPGKYDIPQTKPFASTRLSELTAVELPTCGNQICEAGESYELCPEDCPKSPATKILLTILIVMAVIAALVFIWYKHLTTYAEKIFKTRQDFANIKAYIRVALQKGTKEEEIKRKLSGAGWTKEQIIYAMRHVKMEKRKEKKVKGFSGIKSGFGR